MKKEKEYQIRNTEWQVPSFLCLELSVPKKKSCVCIPVINEGDKIRNQLRKMRVQNINRIADIIIADGGSTDGSLDRGFLRSMKIKTLLTLQDTPGLSTQMRMAIGYALQEGYENIVFIDGNDKDDVSRIPLFFDSLKQGYEHIGASRFMKGGKEINTPIYRKIPLKFIHIPLLSLAAGYKFTDTTYGFRGYSRKFLLDKRIMPLRNIFKNYELHYYLALKAARLGYKIKEIPSTRIYPKKGKIPTKISFIRGNYTVLKNLLMTCLNRYDPR